MFFLDFGGFFCLLPYTIQLFDDSPVIVKRFCAIALVFVRHPLFSLLALMLEKCEQATQGYVSQSSTSSTSSSSANNQSSNSPNGTPSNGGGSGSSSENADSFSRDVQAFVHLLEKEKRPLLTNNAELDGLVRFCVILLYCLYCVL